MIWAGIIAILYLSCHERFRNAMDLVSMCLQGYLPFVVTGTYFTFELVINLNGPGRADVCQLFAAD